MLSILIFIPKLEENFISTTPSMEKYVLLYIIKFNKYRKELKTLAFKIHK